MWSDWSSLPHNPPSSALVSDWQVRWTIGTDRPRFKVWCTLIINRWLPKFSTSWDGCLKETHYSRWWFQIFFIITPNPGEMIQFDEHIFQMGWNHQLVLNLQPFFPYLFSKLTLPVEDVKLVPEFCWSHRSDVVEAIFSFMASRKNPGPCLVMNKWANDDHAFSYT